MSCTYEHVHGKGPYANAQYQSCAYANAHPYTHKHIYTYKLYTYRAMVCVHVWVRNHTYTYPHVCTCAHACAGAHAQPCIHTWNHGHINDQMHICRGTYMHVSIHTTCKQKTNNQTHTNKQTKTCKHTCVKHTHNDASGGQAWSMLVKFHGDIDYIQLVIDDCIARKRVERDPLAPKDDAKTKYWIVADEAWFYVCTIWHGVGEVYDIDIRYRIYII